MLVFDACKIIREKMGLTDTQRESPSLSPVMISSGKTSRFCGSPIT